MTIYIDIDGTLTTTPTKAWGPVRDGAIERVRKLVYRGHAVYIWSARGKNYASQFVEKYGIKGVTTLSKPDVLVDDVAGIRDPGRIRRIGPEEFIRDGI